MRLVVGLGNPGPKHKNNRHNIGFMAADEIVRRHRLSAPRTKFHGDISEGDIAGEKVLVLKPATFMNESGRSVGDAVRFYKLSAEDVLVIYDEIDLAAAKLRVKQGGGHAGHNGLRSIDAHLNDQNYWRVRLGVGHPGEKSQVSNHVLGDFSKQDRQWVEQELSAVADELPLLLQGQPNDFTSRVGMAVQDQTGNNKKTDTPVTDRVTATHNRPAPDETTETALGSALSRAMDRLRGRE
jgi:PTH1 family peptidyl-tRNA hydrolase